MRSALVGALALVLGVGLATADVTVDFESPTYTAGGSVIGQDGWAWDDPNFAGVATVTVIDTDNGPSAAGSQCVEMMTAPSGGAAALLSRYSTPEWPTTGEGIVTLQYDIRWVNAGVDGVGGFNTRCRLYDSDSAAHGLNPAHWWGMDSQLYGSQTPDGTTGSWVGNLDDSFWGVGNSYTDWVTWRWVLYVGPGGDPNDPYATGDILYFEVNKNDGSGWVRQRRIDSYLFDDVDGLDQLRLMGYATDGANQVRFDNLSLTVTEGTPSAFPTAVAPAPFNVPGSASGGVAFLDSTGCTDDGQIVHVRWSRANEATTNYYGRTLAYSSATGQVMASLPQGQTTDIELQVMDDTGLEDRDFTSVTVGTWDPTDVPIDNVPDGIIGIKYSDVLGTQTASYELPTGNLSFEVAATAEGNFWQSGQDDQYVFDELGFLYYIQWNGEVRSATPDLTQRWSAVVDVFQNMCNENATLIVGERHLYALGDLAGVGHVYAIDKATGTLVWEVDLVDPDTGFVESWAGDCARLGRPKMILLDNKLYVVGPIADDDPAVANEQWVWQIDCGDGAVPGAVEWADPILVGSTISRRGHLTIVPDKFAAGVHLLVMSGRSDAENDNLSEIVGVRVDADGLTGGATLEWEAESGHAEWSRTIYSGATDVLYHLTSHNWASAELWTLDPLTGGYDHDSDPATMDRAFPIAKAGEFAEGYQYGRLPAATLDWAGTTIYTGGKAAARLYSYTDANDGTGQSFTSAEYHFGDSDVDWRAIGGRNINLRDQGIGMDKKEYLLTTLSEWRWWDPDPNDTDPINQVRQNHEIVLIDTSTLESSSASEDELDDGPFYLDDLVVTYDADGAGPGAPTVLFTDDFESYALGVIPAGGLGPWTYGGDTTDFTAEIVTDPAGGSNQVLKIDPYGANDQDQPITQLFVDMGGSYGGAGDPGLISFQFNQYRADTCDNVQILTYNSTPNFGQAGGFEWDQSGTLIGVSESGGWGPEATIVPNVWQAAVIDIDYGSDALFVSLDGAFMGTPPVFLPADPMEQLEIWMWATRASCQTLPPPPINEFAARYQASELNPSPPVGNGRPNTGIPEALSISPTGDIFFYQSVDTGPYDRRITRLRVVGEDVGLCGDMNCDGVVDVFDINPFVQAILDPAGYAAAFPACDINNGDINNDGAIDVFDINPFVDEILNGTGCTW